MLASCVPAELYRRTADRSPFRLRVVIHRGNQSKIPVKLPVGDRKSHDASEERADRPKPHSRSRTFESEGNLLRFV